MTPALLLCIVVHLLKGSSPRLRRPVDRFSLTVVIGPLFVCS